MDQLPKTLVLKGSRKKFGVMLLITLPLLAGGVFLVREEPSGFMGWAVVLFFGLCASIFVFQIIKPGTLVLNETGFEQTMMGRKTSNRWDEVSEFGIYAIKSSFVTASKFVCFDRYADEGKKMTELNRTLVGATAQLADTFGMKAEALAELMNAFRNRALKG